MLWTVEQFLPKSQMSWTHIEHNMCGRWAAWSPLWRWPWVYFIKVSLWAVWGGSVLIGLTPEPSVMIWGLIVFDVHNSKWKAKYAMCLMNTHKNDNFDFICIGVRISRVVYRLATPFGGLSCFANDIYNHLFLVDLLNCWSVLHRLLISLITSLNFATSAALETRLCVIIFVILPRLFKFTGCR